MKLVFIGLDIKNELVGQKFINYSKKYMPPLCLQFYKNLDSFLLLIRQLFKTETLNQNHLRRFIRLPEVLHRTGLSRTTVYRLMATNEFPRQIPLGCRIVVWNEKEIDQWMKEKKRG